MDFEEGGWVANGVDLSERNTWTMGQKRVLAPYIGGFILNVSSIVQYEF